MSSTLPRKGRKQVEDITGLQFGRLTVIKYLGRKKHRKHYWLCKCTCGGTIELPRGGINKPYGVRSCGCLRKETCARNRQDPTKHGLHKHKLYAIYHSMLNRCYNPKSQRYQYYGAKGISVCFAWRESFLDFYEWSMSNGYEEGLSIDRIESAVGYYPKNCEWVTVSENSRRMNANRKR